MSENKKRIRVIALRQGLSFIVISATNSRVLVNGWSLRLKAGLPVANDSGADKG